MKTSLKSIAARTLRWMQAEFGFPFLEIILTDHPSPPGPPARLVEDRIELSRPFIEAMEAAGIAPERLVRLLVARQANGFTHIPGGLHDLLELYGHLRAGVYSETGAARFLYAYIDLWNDIDLAQNHGLRDDLKEVYEVSVRNCRFVLSDEDPLYQIIVGIFGNKVNLAFSINLSPVYIELVRQLSELDFLDTTDRGDEISRFGAALSKVFFFRTRQRVSTSGTSADRGEPPPRWPVGSGLDRYLGDNSDIETAVAEFSAFLGERMTDRLLEALSRLGAPGVTTAGFQDGRWWFYRTKAKRFAVPVEPKIATTTPPPIPLELTDWGLDDRPELVNPFASMGRVALPGLTQKWQIQGVDSNFHVSVIPDLLILIDSSGSMPNPRLLVSYPVLGSIVVALTYLRLGSAVAVYNFSDADLVLDFSTEEPAVLKTIASYKCGGVERIDTAIVDRLLTSRHKAGREVDVVLASDMALSAEEEQRIASLVRAHKDVNRLFFLVKGANIAKTDRAFAGKVTIFPMNDEKDIAALALSVSHSLSRTSIGGQNV